MVSIQCSAWAGGAMADAVCQLPGAGQRSPVGKPDLSSLVVNQVLRAVVAPDRSRMAAAARATPDRAKPVR